MYRRGRSLEWLGLGLALALAIAAYAHSLRVPFQFDDIQFVRDNRALRRLWPPSSWIHSRWQETRPVTNLTLALNRAWSGPDPWSDHAVNLALHLACVALLFLFVRRSLRILDPAWPERAGPAAATAALLLAAHPLQSESVIYVQGRPGLLAAVFGLGALALAARWLPAWAEGGRRALRTAGVAVCIVLAALSKESAAVLPLLILIYDFAVIGRGRWEAVQARLASVHLPLWCALLPLAAAFATLSNPHRGVFGWGTVETLGFYLTQPRVLMLYLKLFVWPVGLSVDHGMDLASAADPGAWAGLGMLLALILFALWLLRRRGRWAGFCLMWWLAAVAPTSLIPSREFVAERYLTFAVPALAALTAWVLTAGAARVSPPAVAALTVVAGVALAITLALLAYQRGQAWHSGSSLWRDAVAVSPDQPRPWFQYAWFLWQENHVEEAERAARRAMVTPPVDPGRARTDLLRHRTLLLLSRIESDLGRRDSALAHASLGAERAPGDPETQNTLGHALMGLSRWADAEAAFDRALAADSTDVESLRLRGKCRAELWDTAGARADGEAIERLRPDLAAGPYVLGLIELRAGRNSAAADWFATALRRDPHDVETLRLGGLALFHAGRPAEAIATWQRYFAQSRAAGRDWAMLYYRGRALLATGRDAEAVDAFRSTLEIRPNLGPAWIELAYTLAASRDLAVRDRAGARSALDQAVSHADSSDPQVARRLAEIRAAMAGAGGATGGPRRAR